MPKPPEGVRFPHYCSKRECHAFSQSALEALVSQYTDEHPGHCQALEDVPVEQGEPCLAAEGEYLLWLRLKREGK